MTEATVTGGPWRALVIQHEEPTPGGLANEWLVERGAEIETLRIDEQDPHDLDASDYGLIVSLGSEFPAYDDSIRWIEHEADLFRQAFERDVPILGLCFGGQLLARVLGGRVFRAEREEIGWLPVRTLEPELVSEGPWFQWHFDAFTSPPGSQVIATTTVGDQAYMIGRNLGLQFHPEVTPEIMDEWVRAYPHELEEHGVDPEGLLRETHERREATRASAWTLFDRFLERIARPRERV
ncbi:MAG: type 1 glutamine amidotransferase [Actinomycetota bacterium]|nr:type 1 glutamine amidotransferase [Actinomycetota bacterium]